ncbi:MAG: dienelactone hydrolase family protein [Planctomycetota bacterium JB042]
MVPASLSVLSFLSFLSLSSLLPQDTGLTGVLSEDAFKALHELSEADVPASKGVELELADGTPAYLSLPEDAEGPLSGVIVLHEWWGLNRHIRHWTDRLAADGHAALAIDLYRGEVAETRDDAMELMRGVDEDAALKSLKTAHAFLVEDERVKATRTATVGWCFGGGWSLKAARTIEELDAAVIYYGRLTTDPEELRPIRAELLGVFGNQDRGIPPETVDAFEAALKEADVEARILRYDANHAFANPSSARYDEESAAAAWKEVRAFLKQALDPDAR